MIHKATVLVAEDEKQARLSLAALLEDEGYRVIQASDGHEASRLFSQCAPEAALLDIRMPGKDGLALLRELRASPHPPAVLIMTAYGNSTVAIEAMTLGAFDYIAKPVNFSELLIQLERAIGNRRRIRELEIYRAEEPPEPEPEIIGSGPAMQRVYKQIGQVAPSDSTVLLRGESGTGKELAARAIHRHSPRAARRLVKVNCAAIPEPCSKPNCSVTNAALSPVPPSAASASSSSPTAEPFSSTKSARSRQPSRPNCSASSRSAPSSA